MNEIREQWLQALGTPGTPIPHEKPVLLYRREEETYTLEMYSQINGEGTAQRLLMGFPKNAASPCPAVAVPFYVAGQMLGYDPETGAVHPRYQKVPIMLDLLRRGYAVASADSYHLTYYESPLPPMDFTRWKEAAEKLRQDHPHWTGVGKLISDTRLVIDALTADPRVDADRIGIIGFSLGGKMAFYTGCMDERIKAICAIDFGFLWHQTNWRDIWYWGNKVDDLIKKGMDHGQLLSACAPKPLCILGGEFDTEESGEMLLHIQKTVPGYAPDDCRLQYLRYGHEHRPTPEALAYGYDFLDRWLKK